MDEFDELLETPEHEKNAQKFIDDVAAISSEIIDEYGFSLEISGINPQLAEAEENYQQNKGVKALEFFWSKDLQREDSETAGKSFVRIIATSITSEADSTKTYKFVKELLSLAHKNQGGFAGGINPSEDYIKQVIDENLEMSRESADPTDTLILFFSFE